LERCVGFEEKLVYVHPACYRNYRTNVGSIYYLIVVGIGWGYALEKLVNICSEIRSTEQPTSVLQDLSVEVAEQYTITSWEACQWIGQIARW